MKRQARSMIWVPPLVLMTVPSLSLWVNILTYTGLTHTHLLASLDPPAFCGPRHRAACPPPCYGMSRFRRRSRAWKTARSWHLIRACSTIPECKMTRLLKQPLLGNRSPIHLANRTRSRCSRHCGGRTKLEQHQAFRIATLHHASPLFPYRVLPLLGVLLRLLPRLQGPLVEAGFVHLNVFPGLGSSTRFDAILNF